MNNSDFKHTNGEFSLDTGSIYPCNFEGTYHFNC